MARTVLLADDSVTAQNMGRRILTDAGYEVITVNNGSAALKKIHENQPDLVVLDVYMPGYGGLEVCQRLKESEATNRIPVLLTVGKMEPFKTDEAKRVRADGHIIKPFDASELLAALTRLEDRIVPQSEGVRGRSKSEPKKSRRLKGEEIGADEGDELRNDRISYLEEVKRRHAKPSDETAMQPAATNASLTGIERQARMAASDTGENEADDAVTFASGPIPAPGAWPGSPQNTAPEFPIEKDPASEATKVEEASVSSEDDTREPTPAAEAVSDSLSGSKSAAAPEPSAAEEETAAAKTESGPRWVAENVALTAEEAVRSLDEEMRQAQAASDPIPEQEKTQESIQAESQEVAEDEQTANQPEGEISGAAFAAAASASGSSSQAVSGSTTSETPAAAEMPGSLDNWERVRDTVVGQQVAAAIAQSVASMAENQQAAADQPATQPASGDPLSSIVDNVLAELKPRLLAEIAKQLASNKK